MKKALIALAAIVVLAGVGGFIYMGWENDQAFKVIRKCETLKLGMTRDEVMKVMGPPGKEFLATPGRGSVEGEPDKLVMVYWVPSFFDLAPSVNINTATGKAEYIACSRSHVRYPPDYYKRRRKS